MSPSFWSKVENKTENMTEMGWTQSGSKITYDVSEYSKEINDLNPTNRNKSFY